MRVLIAAGAAGVMLSLAAPGLAQAAAGPAPATVTVMDCVLGAGVIFPSSTSATRLTCLGGRYNGSAVGGLA